MRTRRNSESELRNKLSFSDLVQVGNYTLGKTVGQGTFGKVKLASHIFTGVVVAIKIIDKIHGPVVTQEIETLRHLRHPNIAQFYEILTTETKIFLVFEYAEWGELFDYIAKYKKMDDKDIKAKRMFWQMTDAIRYCHEKNYCHRYECVTNNRDLKLENILLDKNLNVKVIDFGFTRNTDNNTLLDTFCGSPAYAAPEIISAKKYSGKRADVWSLGVIFFTMVAGYMPFDEDDEKDMHKKVLGMEFTIPSNLQNDTIDLLKGMIVHEPEQRLTLDSVLDHEWFNDLKEYDPATKRFTDDMIQNLYENPRLLKKLDAAGFQSDRIINSVKNQACDSLSALWHFVSMKSKGSSQKLHSSREILVKSTEMEIDRPLHNNIITHSGLSSDDSISLLKGPRKTSWGEPHLAPNLPAVRVRMRESMREGPILDRARSLSAAPSSIRRKKKNIIEEREEDILF